MEACVMETELQRSCSETQSRWHQELSERRWGRPVKHAAPSWRCEQPDRNKDRPAAAVHPCIRLSTSISLPLYLKILFCVSSRNVKHWSAPEDHVTLTGHISAHSLPTETTWSLLHPSYLTARNGLKENRARLTLFLKKMDWEENNPPTAIIHCL